MTIAPLALTIYPLDSVVAKETVSKVTKIYSLSEISLSSPNDAIVFFDLDDTVFDFPYMLGSKEWRNAIKQSEARNWHDMLSLFLAQTLPVVGVEPSTSESIKNLQSLGYHVYGLTARARDVWYEMPSPGIDALTISQLTQMGVDFEHNLKNDYAMLTKDAAYFQGVFFADDDSKGVYLEKIIAAVKAEKGKLPKKIIFIDDKHSQVESVAASLKKLKIDHECYWYAAIENKAKNYDPLIANIQFYYFWISQGREILSDNDAKIIAIQSPEKDADYYLQAVLTSLQSN